MEEQFYILWPLLFVAIGPKRMPRIALALSALVMVGRGAGIILHPEKFLEGVFYMRPWFRFDALSVGCWLAQSPLPRSSTLVFCASAAALAGWSLYGEPISWPLFTTVQTFLATVFFFSVVRGNMAVRALFSLFWLRWLGKISYSLYLWQQIVVVAYPKLNLIHKFPLNVLIAFTMAILSRQFVEEPFLKLGRKCLRPDAFIRLRRPRPPHLPEPRETRPERSD
jgi:peptidoglycan/LPS O-acetylase OafA/YrhL